MQLQSAAGRSLPLWVAALWSMSLTTLGFFVIPMLFANLPSPAIAGNMAARLFSVQTAISAGSAVLLLILFRWEPAGVKHNVARTLTLIVLAGAMLALLVEFGVSPRITARENLALWHSVGSAMYLVQWICALVTFGKLANAAHG
jgi:hypothetical protein